MTSTLPIGTAERPAIHVTARPVRTVAFYNTPKRLTTSRVPPGRVHGGEDAFPRGASVSRFEWLLATKEHELQHRAQLTVLARLLDLTPRFTGLS